MSRVVRQFIELIHEERKKSQELYQKAIARDDMWESVFQSGKSVAYADLLLKLDLIIKNKVN